MEQIIKFFNSEYMVTFSGIVTLAVALLTIHDKFLMIPSLKIDYLKGILYQDGLLILNFKVINPTMRAIDFYNITFEINGQIVEPYTPKAKTYVEGVKPIPVEVLINKNLIYKNHGTLSKIEKTIITPGLSVDLNLLYDIRILKSTELNKAELFLESSLKRRRMKLNIQNFENR